MSEMQKPGTEDDGFTTVYASRPVPRERRAPQGTGLGLAFIATVLLCIVVFAWVVT